MKKQFIIATIVLAALVLGVANASVSLEYRVNLLEYFRLSGDYTDGEKRVLALSAPVVYGGNISEPPLGIYDSENGQYTGMVVDYINALSIELGVPVVSRPMVWHEALAALKEGETDLCDMIPSAERMQSFAFTAPVYDLNGIIVAPMGAGAVTQVWELRGRKVAVQRGDYALEYLKSMGVPIQAVYADNMSDAMRLLQAGAVDAAVGDEPVAWHYLKLYGMEQTHQVLEKPLYKAQCALAVSKTRPDLQRVLDKAVFKLRQKGILEQIQKKWSSPSPTFYADRSAERFQLTVMFLSLALCVGLYLIWVWSRSLKHLVGVRTRELQRLKTGLETVLDSMVSFLAVVDADGRVVMANKAFRQAFQEVDLMPEVEAVPVLKALEDRWHLFSSWREDPEAFRLPDHCAFTWNRRTLDCRFSRIEGAVEGEGLLVVLTDDTVRRHQESRLSHANKMESVGVLAAGLAHELRNPLGIIRNSAYLLNTLGTEEEADRRTVVQAMENAISRASGIIENLLKYSRLTTDHLETVNVRRYLEEVLGLFACQLSECGIRLRLECDPQLEWNLNGGPLWHGLLNILQNAVDAMREGGELQVTAQVQGARLVIRVADNGPGMTDAVLERIFDPFYTTKPVGKGTGLGLYVAYTEVQNAGGTLAAESSPGKGTVFTITLGGGEALE